MDYLYKLNREDMVYRKLLDENIFFLNILLPNNVNIFQLKYISKEIVSYVKMFYSQMLYLIYPVYKHSWKNKNLFLKIKNNYIYIICEQSKNVLDNYEYYDYTLDQEVLLNMFMFHPEKIELIEKNNTYFISISTLNYILTLEAYSFLYIHILEYVTKENMNYLIILGILEACTKLGFGSIPFKQNEYRNPENTKYKFIFETNTLKSLYISNQIRFFNAWKNKKDILLTGGTGIGKTSQIPKLFWWINFLFDGFSELQFNNFEFDLIHIQKNKIINNFTLLSLPRKILITENCSTILNSLGYKNINNSPINCKFKDVDKTKFYNENIKKNISPFIISINRLSSIKNVNTIIFDEIHEHDTYGDIGISKAKFFKKKYNIRNIILISATVVDDLDNINNFFPGIEHIYIKGGTLFPIEIIEKYTECNKQNNFFNIDKIISEYSTNVGKSTLLFLPTLSSIVNMKEVLINKLNNDFYVIIELHRNAIIENKNIIQDVLSYENKHVVVLTTPIAESSLTIPNAEVVIDTGLFYSKQFFSGKVIYITQSMMEQRMGRVGRVNKGIYIRLFDIKKRNTTFKKIDYEFLVPYIVNCLYFNIPFTELFVLPTDLSRFDKTIEYYKNKNVDFVKDIYKIYEIFNQNILLLNEYLIIYLNGTPKQKEVLYYFENISEDDTENLKAFLNLNKEIIKEICELMDIQITIYKTKYIYDENYTINELGFVNIPNYYEKINNLYVILLNNYFDNKQYLLKSSLALC